MFKSRKLRFVLSITTLAMIVSLALSDAVFAKHGRGGGRFNGRKSVRFINGHDARDGRWDGRGPFNERKRRKFINGHDARDGRWDGRGPRDRFDLKRGRFINPRVLGLPRGGGRGRF